MLSTHLRVAFLILQSFLRYFNVPAIHVVHRCDSFKNHTTAIINCRCAARFIRRKLPCGRPTEVSAFAGTLDAEKIRNCVQQKRLFISYDYGDAKLMSENRNLITTDDVFFINASKTILSLHLSISIYY